MKTIPDIRLKDHIQNLVGHLKKRIPEISSDSLIFYKREDSVETEKGWVINRSELMEYEKFESIFKGLCDEGRCWIYLSGESWYGDSFLISVDFSEAKRQMATLISLGGPALDKDGKPRLLPTYLTVLE